MITDPIIVRLISVLGCQREIAASICGRGIMIRGQREIYTACTFGERGNAGRRVPPVHAPGLYRFIEAA